MTVRVLELLDANKAKAAFLAPLVTAIMASLGSLVVTGDWNDTEIRTAVSGVLLSLASGFATYVTPAGDARVERVEPTGPRVERRSGIASERGYGLVEVAFALLIVVLAVGLLLHFT